MRAFENELGQPIGFPVPNWKPPPVPTRVPIAGRFCRLEPLDLDRHADALYKNLTADSQGRNWTYMQYGPFDSRESFVEWVRTNWLGADPLFFAICGAEGDSLLADGSRYENAEGASPQGMESAPLKKMIPLGLASYLRIAAPSGSIEIGNLNFSPKLQRTVVATDGLHLMMRSAFALGYRRLEWKCDALNSASRRAAQRLGFSFEGIFRQALVYKGRNRDSAWYSIIDSEWPELQAQFERWLDPANFDTNGQQRIRLSQLTGPLLKAIG